jgi:DNA-binding IclR family transcriptional regulator
MNQRTSTGPRLYHVDRALDLLEILAVTNKGITLSEVSRKLGIAKSSAHSLLYTLVARAYIERSTDGHHFRLGPRAFEFANLTLEELELRKVASPHMEKLAKKLKMNALLAVRKGRQAVIIDNCGLCGLLTGAWIGIHAHLHASAAGKILIAYLSDAELERLFRGHPLIKFTPNTLTSLEALKAHLADVRAQGFAVNNEEDNVGWKTVAAPIFNYVEEVFAAVCAQGATDQIHDWRISKLAEEVISTARDISRNLTA